MAIAGQLVKQLVERRAGPETPASEALAAEIRRLEFENQSNRAQIEKLERDRQEIRRAARKPSWWLENRQALIVNMVAGLIVGIPFFILGIVATLLLA